MHVAMGERAHRPPPFGLDKLGEETESAQLPHSGLARDEKERAQPIMGIDSRFEKRERYPTIYFLRTHTRLERGEGYPPTLGIFYTRHEGRENPPTPLFGLKTDR